MLDGSGCRMLDEPMHFQGLIPTTTRRPLPIVPAACYIRADVGALPISSGPGVDSPPTERIHLALPHGTPSATVSGQAPLLHGLVHGLQMALGLCPRALQPFRVLLEATRRRVLRSFVVVFGRGQGEFLYVVASFAFPLDEPGPIFLHQFQPVHELELSTVLSRPRLAQRGNGHVRTNSWPCPAHQIMSHHRGSGDFSPHKP
jgi:hypothetical protein